MAARAQLKDYNARRDFRHAPEPKGDVKRRKGKPVFVVQKHDARRLHYDFRLEHDGVLLSWAVTKGPSLDPSDKRLAVRTEDHPMEYAGFEGVIPKGEYGGGTVMVWDKGTWEPVTDPDEGLEEGHLKFTLHGERMKGRWVLVRMKPKDGEKRENWLLIKEKDEFASGDEDLTGNYDTSIETDRTLADIAEGEDGKRKGKPRAKRLANPDFIEPQLATLVDDVPSGGGWLHEVKFDGYRALASIGKSGVVMYSRSGLDWTDRFAGVPEALDRLDCRNALIDGEIISLHPPETGSGFSALQSDLEAGRSVRFMAFDLMVLDGKDLRDQPIETRKEKLKRLLGPVSGKAVRFSEHVTGNGRHVYDRVAAAGGEGIISKKAGSKYQSTRTRTWRKIKVASRQEFVIGGYSPSSSHSRPFASLLLGTYEDGKLVYRGRVGTGFGEDKLDELASLFKGRERKTPPFDGNTADLPGKAQWLRPDLVAEVDFSEFTAQGMVRHAVFVGLRQDKDAKDVTRERKQTPDEDQTVKVAGISISHAGRVVFEGAGITKADVARYYDAAGDRLMNEAGNRPVSLLRCPSGALEDCFFQKHAGKGFPDEIDSMEIEEASGEVADYMVIRDKAGFVAAAQMGTIEFHIWGAQADDLERPDRVVFDLDPDEDLGFDAVKQAATELRGLLDELGLESVPMVTGGKGIHVIVPLRRGAGWETVKLFARTVASHFADQKPDRYVATMSKARRKGRVFIDWLRNERGATAVAPYSIRNRKGAPVAVPLDWAELDDVSTANSFSLADARNRLRSGCPLEAVSRTRTISNAVVSKLDKLTGE
jgi:bifunctional non-homologous end joining protein LigD